MQALSSHPHADAGGKKVQDLWSTEESTTFFDALAVYGKDFDMLQMAMSVSLFAHACFLKGRR